MEYLKLVEQKAGVPVDKLMSYSLYIGVALVMLGVGQTYITQVIGVAYPAFMSFIALETDSKDDDKQWLTYWVCFGAFNIVDQFAGIILQFIPFYFFLKLGFLVYLFHPATLGATSVFNEYVLPYVRQYEDKILEAEKQLQDQYKKAQQQASNLIGEKKD